MAILKTKTMRLLKSFYIFSFLLLVSCGNQPQKISGVNETIEVSNMHWACDCADFVEVKFYKSNPNYEVKDTDCIFIEPSSKDNKIPDEYYDGEKSFEYHLELSGQFYIDKGVPDSYNQKTPEIPEKAKVFRYDSYKIIK
ncbi:hypothetical protein AR687_10400 [Flavobacteriaceae bacterium CRH]|nr:hypothetical protein AR687_10400 [Flavobacteriaceae bacterium CRH]